MRGILILIILYCATSIQSVNAQQQAKSIDVEFEMQYLIYLPKNYYKKSDDDFPLLLFLHGAGERGHNLELVKTHGPPKLAEKKNFPFIIVSPQCNPNDQWTSEFYQAMLIGLIDELDKIHRIDRNRIYVTGLSMGGFGAWELATRHPDKIAAIAPICGGGDPEKAWNLRHTAVWAFHGAQDEAVPVERSQEMIRAIEKYNDNAKLTVYPDTGHDSWTEAYEKSDLMDWFEDQELYKPEEYNVKNRILKSYEGEYKRPGKTYEVDYKGGELIIEEGDNEMTLIPESDTMFVIKGQKRGVEFIVEGEENVKGFRFLPGNGSLVGRVQD